MKDNDGFDVGPGDKISFSYGIPPVRVNGKIVERDGKLIVLTPGHNPAEANLRTLRQHVGAFYKVHEL